MNIGEPKRIIEVIPIPNAVPEPTPAPIPKREPVKVPEKEPV